MHSTGFVHAGVEVGQITCLPKASEIVQLTCSSLLVELRVELLQCRRVVEKVIEQSSEEDGGAVAAGSDVGPSPYEKSSASS